MPDLAELHVLPHQQSGTWLVGVDASSALSWHGTASEAELAAQRHAEVRGTRRIYLHDRYQRVRAVPLDTSRPIHR